MSLNTYGHVFDEANGAEESSAEAAIAAARRVPTTYPREHASADKLELAWSRQDKTLSLETGDREALLNVLADGPDELADLGSVLLQEQERRRAGGH
jgi:hypothetical protein